MPKVLDALQTISMEEFDVIICDIFMPKLSGMDFLTAATKQNSITPVILITGQPSMEISLKALRQGAFDFLIKPFSSETMCLTLERALKYRSVLIENRNHQLHLEAMVEKRTRELQDFLLQSVKSLTHALEAKDPYTQGHGYNVSRLVIELAEELAVDEDDYLDLKLAAELHDIGKIGVPDAILLKPGKLTGEEYELMKEHVTIGYRILSPIPTLMNVSRYVHEHHERMDGKGYPRGLSGDEIHYNSQLLVVAEVCDALAAKRCYKPPWSKEKIIGYFQENSGTAFHPEVTDALISVLQNRGEEILTMLQSNNGS
jgi:response regulator RpfG family c-di-GMP phosphodiesterase